MTPVDPLAVAASVARVLDQVGTVDTIGGSIAASFAGEPRFTVDIDVVAALHESRIDLVLGHEEQEATVRRELEEVARQIDGCRAGAVGSS